jgi:hypothetical protein
MPHDAYAPYTPLDTLKSIARDLWIVDGPEIWFGYFGLKLPFPTRMTIVRLPDGALWLHSPTKPTDTLVSNIEAIGPVKFLIAPNTIHYWWIPDWKARFPAAEIYAAPGLAHVAKRDVPVQHTLANAPPAVWAEILDQLLVDGDVLTEVDFFHRPSGTLILTDLIENFELGRIRNWFYRLLVRIGGASDPDGKTPIDMQLSFLRQRNAVRAAVQRMIAWEPERIIIAHGRWYERNAPAELKRAFRWVL